MIEISDNLDNLGQTNQSLGTVWDNASRDYMEKQMDTQQQQQADMSKQFQEQMDVAKMILGESSQPDKQG